jgi:hypothetical protein
VEGRDGREGGREGGRKEGRKEELQQDVSSSSFSLENEKKKLQMRTIGALDGKLVSGL